MNRKFINDCIRLKQSACKLFVLNPIPCAQPQKILWEWWVMHQSEQRLDLERSQDVSDHFGKRQCHYAKWTLKWAMGWKLQDKTKGAIFSPSSTRFRPFRKMVLFLKSVVFKIIILLEILKITVALGNVFNVQIYLTHLSGAMGKLQIKKIHKISTHQCLRETSHLGRPFFFAYSDPNSLFFPFDLEHRSYLLFADQVIWVKALE